MYLVAKIDKKTDLGSGVEKYLSTTPVDKLLITHLRFDFFS